MDSKELYDLLIKIQCIAKIGLVHSTDPYAITNYNEINDLTKKYLEDLTEVKIDRPNFFERDIYPTPSISARVVIFNKDRNKILLVREANSQTYSMPGGWCDLYDSPAQTAINEARQEAGADIKVERLVGILNRTPFKSNITIPEYVVIFEGSVIGDLHEHEYETDDVGWFDLEKLPTISRKISIEEMTRMVDAAKNNKTIFD